MDRFDPRWVWFGCSIICTISIVGFSILYLRTREQLNEKQRIDAARNGLTTKKENMPQDSVFVFVCEHGAAKSVIAAAYFNKLALEANLGSHAIARGTHPDPELSPQAIQGMRADGLMPTETAPQKLSLSDMGSAQRIITFCELPEEFQHIVDTEQWNEIPPVSEDYNNSRDVIIERLNRLVNTL